jgi:hypothetical protein
MTDFNNYCLGGCNPPQVLSLTYAVNDISNITVYDSCDPYDMQSLEWSYSIDGVCWSCYMSYDEILANTVDLNSDYYVKIKIPGIICKVQIDGNDITDYDTSLVPGFNFNTDSSNTYNPYANTEGALALQQNLADTVSEIVGIPIYYFKLSPNAGSKDITFKEYALMDVEAVKQIKMVIQDGTMPSSKPEFAEWGLEFQTDWEPEISKSSFATAFGNTAQPMEGDLIYVPMMKRMWMVNGAYEEKNGNLMWQATTFKVMLSKYQEKDSVDLGDTENLVNSFVKNKYEDLFGEDNQGTLSAGEPSLEAPKYAENSLYPVFESDATRKYMTCDSINIIPNNVYYRGTLISDSKYSFAHHNAKSQIIYQSKFCGEELTVSFILNPGIIEEFKGKLISIGSLSINIEQNIQSTILYLNVNKEVKIDLANNSTYLCVLRISKCMNLVDFMAYLYTYNENIPLYKLQNNHYYFNMDNPISKYIGKYDIEYYIAEKSDVIIYDYYGTITNFKLFDIYNDQLRDVLQMYPNNQHLQINDTARKLVGLSGVAFR